MNLDFRRADYVGIKWLRSDLRQVRTCWTAQLRNAMPRGLERAGQQSKVILFSHLIGIDPSSQTLYAYTEKKERGEEIQEEVQRMQNVNEASSRFYHVLKASRTLTLTHSETGAS